MKKSISPIKTTLIATLFFFIISVVGAFATYSLSYPTQSHRNIAHKLSSTDMLTKDGKPNPQYDALLETPESTYSSGASAIAFFATSVLFIASIGIAFTHLRKHRIDRPVVRVAAASAVGTTLANLATLSYAPYYIGNQTSWTTLFGVQEMPLMMQVGVGAVALGTSLLFSYLIALVVALVFEHLYKRKHSFVIE